MKKIFRQYLLIATMLICLSGCNLPKATATSEIPADDDNTVATQVQLLLTQIPTLTPKSVVPTTISTIPPTITPTLEATTVSTIAPTAAPSSTPLLSTPTIPVSTDDPRLSLGSPTWTDNFDNGDNFSIYSDSHIDITDENGYLNLTALKADKWYSWTLANPVVTDFYMETTVKTSECSGKDRYGLVFRSSQTNKGYIYGFSCEGEYGLSLWNGSKFISITDWTSNSAISAGADIINRLGIRVEGNVFKLYANGIYLTQAENSTLADNGKFGLFIASYNTEGFTVSFDEISYWELP